MYKVYNKFLGLTGSIIKWYFLGFALFLLLVITLVTKDFLAVVSMVIALGVIYFGSVMKKQEEQDLFPSN